MDQQQEPSSWFWNWALAALFGWGGAHAWTLVAQGASSGWLLVACVVSWFLAFSKGIAGLHAWDNAAVLRDGRKHIHTQAEASTEHGAAHWATPAELKKAGMFKLKPGGFFLGRVGGKDLNYHGEGMITLGIPGTGKSSNLITPFLLHNTSPRGKVTGTIVVDVKLELWLTTHRERERKGDRVVVISPWYKEFSDQFGGGIKTADTGFDPCCFLEASEPSIIDDCRLLASLLLPQNGESNETDSFFRDGSIDVLLAFMLLGLSKSNRITLPDLRADIMAPKEVMADSIAAMLGSEAFSGSLAELGARLATPFMDAPKELSGMLAGARRALAVYDRHGPLGRSVRKAGFDPRTFRDQRTTIYIAIPLEKIGTHSNTWLATVITVLQELISRDRRPTQVIFIVDELQNLGRQEALIRGPATLRGAGFKYWFLTQHASALASPKLYGRDWKTFLGCGATSFLGSTADLETLNLISELAGQETFVQDPTYSEQVSQEAGKKPNMSLSSGTQGRPLIRPAEIKTLLGNDGHLMFAVTLPPILAKKVSYLSVRKWRRLADPNPYYAKR